MNTTHPTKPLAADPIDALLASHGLRRTAAARLAPRFSPLVQTDLEATGDCIARVPAAIFSIKKTRSRLISSNFYIVLLPR